MKFSTGLNSKKFQLNILSANTTNSRVWYLPKYRRPDASGRWESRVLRPPSPRSEAPPLRRSRGHRAPQPCAAVRWHAGGQQVLHGDSPPCAWAQRKTSKCRARSSPTCAGNLPSSFSSEAPDDGPEPDRPPARPPDLRGHLEGKLAGGDEHERLEGERRRGLPPATAAASAPSISACSTDRP